MGLNFEHLLTEYATVTIRNPTANRDAYGNVLTLDMSRATFCWHHQTVRTERDPLAEETWDAYFPAGDPISASDAVTIDGISYEVIGRPWQSTNPRTADRGQVEATLRRTDG